MSTTTASRLTTKNKAGLVLAGLLGASDVGGPSSAPVALVLLLPVGLWPAIIGLLVVNVILGVATIAGVVLIWVRGSRIAARVVAAARIVAVLIVVPALVTGGPEVWMTVLAAALVIFNITAIVLVLSRPGTMTT